LVPADVSGVLKPPAAQPSGSNLQASGIPFMFDRTPIVTWIPRTGWSNPRAVTTTVAGPPLES
jgi:hypothetical protein